MQNILRLTLILFLLNQATSVCGQNTKELIAIRHEGLKEENVLYLKDSTKGIATRSSFDDNQEINYISNGVSNVGIAFSENKIYMWWEVCDDLTQSVYEIYQTKGDGHYVKIAEQKNQPSNIHVPLLYCFNFENKNYENQFLLLYKKYENGSMSHIITLIIPKQTIQQMMTKL